MVGPLETAISDLEVEHRQVKGSIWHIKYQVENSEEFVVVATTRPETLLGDTAVAVHPEDARYRHLIGKNVVLPLLGRKIPVISDVYVEPTFGSGVVKITPAHDFNDYKIGKAHNLPMINILTTKTEINEHGGNYKGLKVQEARKRILEDLTTQGLMIKEEPHVLNVGHCSRTGAVAEPFLSEQWFVRMESLSVPARRAVESDTTIFEPESWTKTYLHWMSIIEDWCISRQLWWGHRIPAWNCDDCKHITVAEVTPTACEKCQSNKIHQDEDVLDTWFSSALWPFSTMGWPENTETLKTFYPTSVLVTGHDIIFFWVARMMIMGLDFMKDVPFRKVYIHGLVRDSQGRKMSKSLGNSVDPVELIEKYGADALRFSFLAHINSGKDFKFNEQRIEGYRNFMNKLWNATRFSLMSLADYAPNGKPPLKGELSNFDQWIVHKLMEVEKSVEQFMEQDRFSDAAMALYSFTWYEFCDWYIELIKPVVSKDRPVSAEKSASQYVLSQVLNRVMRLLHPFIPFITEELYQKLPSKSAVCMLDVYPTVKNDKEFLAFGNENSALEIDVTKEVLTAIRNIRGENRISPAEKIKARLACDDEMAQKILGNNRDSIISLGRLTQLDIGTTGSLAKCAVTPIQIKGLEIQVIVPLEGLVDLDEEVKRIQKQIEKLGKEIMSMSGRLSNPNFLQNAAEDIVAADKEALARSEVQVKTFARSSRASFRDLEDSVSRFPRS